MGTIKQTDGDQSRWRVLGKVTRTMHGHGGGPAAQPSAVPAPSAECHTGQYKKSEPTASVSAGEKSRACKNVKVSRTNGARVPPASWLPAGAVCVMVAERIGHMRRGMRPIVAWRGGVSPGGAV